MANIENALVISWANSRARPLCDAILNLYQQLTQFQADYAGFGIAAAITGDPAGATAKIDDGSVPGGTNTLGNGVGDGRQNVTGTQMQNLIAAVNQLVTATGTTLVSGVGATPVAIAQGIHVQNQG